MQSYINAILECLQSRKCCEAIIDDLLLFTATKKTHMVKLEDLLRVLLKHVKYPQSNVNFLEESYSTWKMTDSLNIRGICHTIVK